jgi:hypothetical protein
VLLIKKQNERYIEWQVISSSLQPSTLGLRQRGLNHRHCCHLRSSQTPYCMHTPSLLLAGAHFNDLTSLALSLSQQFLHHSSSLYVCVCVYASWQNTRALCSPLYTLLLLSLLLLAPPARVGVLLLVLVVKGALIDLLEKLSPRKQQPHRVCAGCILR